VENMLNCYSSFYIFFPIVISARTDMHEVYIYGFAGLNSSKTVLEYFGNKTCCEITFYNLNDPERSERFLEIVNVFQILGVKILPSNKCLSCTMRKLPWKEIWTIFASPLIGFFHDGDLTAVTIGVIDPEILDQALISDDRSEIKVFTSNGIYDLRDEGSIAIIENLFFDKEKATEIDFVRFLPSVILLAAVDSINPCTFAVFTALLFITLFYVGRGRSIVTGSLFILAVFIGYFFLGAGLLQIFAMIPSINKAFALIGLAVGSLSIIRGLSSKPKSPVPRKLSKFMDLQIKKSYVDPIASFTLLPCTSGPYIVGLGLISVLDKSVYTFLLLTLYNIIFVAPLIMILIITLASKSMAYKIKAFRSKRIRLMDLISGSLLILVCIYLLLA